jgi:ABC-2 type transport system permease protein
MSVLTDTADTVPGPAVPPRAARPTQPFLWSIRREIWENASLYIAPVVAAGLTALAFAIVMIKAPIQGGPLDASHVEMSDGPVLILLAGSGFILIAVTYLVGLFYCLGALQHERRDRSILFWKSLPVSDVTTVFAKVAIPMLVLPAITVGVMIITQILLLAGGGAVLAAHGVDPMLALGQPDVLRAELLLIYLVFVLALWHAPIYGWALLVSGWARNVSLLWAVLPPLAVVVFQQLVFGDDSVGRIINHRVFAGPVAAFRMAPEEISRLRGINVIELHSDMAMPHIDLMGYLASPGLWIGLALAAAFIGAAIWLRRYRDPV